MFAYLKEDGTIAGFVEAIPDPIQPPDPLPEGYVPPPVIEYREVSEGTRPNLTTPFSTPLENPTIEWTITSTQAIKTWTEYTPPLSTCRAIKKAFLTSNARTERDAGISVATAGYGTLIFSTDAMSDMLACSHICDLLIRQNVLNGNNNINLVLRDNSIQQVLVREVMPIVLSYCVEYHRRRVLISQKLLVAAQAATLNDLIAITY